MTQTEMIMAYMREFGSITQWEATKEIGCLRLGARIWDLKHAGVDIEKTMVADRNRYGKPVRYARYSLPQA